MANEADLGFQTTDVHTGNVITLLQSVLASRDPSRRAQYLSDAQRELGWAQRSAIEECQREKKLSWRQLGAVVSVAHDALYRQFASGGPVVTASPFYSKESRNNMMTTTAQLAIAFRTVDDGRLHVLAEADVQGLDSFTMPFNPGNPSPYSGRDLQYYYRPAPGLALADLGRSAGYTMRPEGFGIAFCLTEGVMDELFGPPFIGSPERRHWEADLEERQRNARPVS
jgi:hypothetical protein